jgi:hypothetical protein
MRLEGEVRRVRLEGEQERFEGLFGSRGGKV